MSDRKHMKKIREKRIVAIEKQIEKHEYKIENEEGRLPTTKEYWRKEIDEKFMKQMKKDKKFLGEEENKTEQNGNPN